MFKDLEKILEFQHYVAKLKRLIRWQGSNWNETDIARFESVTDHTYRMALLGINLADYLEDSHKVDITKVLKMVLVHDIVELEAEDENAIESTERGGGHAFDNEAFNSKYNKEIKASNSIFSKLPSDQYVEFKNLFKEYIDTKANPEKATLEGKFAYALDKIEALMQAIEYKQEIGSWDPIYREDSLKYCEAWCKYDAGLMEYFNLLKEEALRIEHSNGFPTP